MKWFFYRAWVSSFVKSKMKFMPCQIDFVLHRNESDRLAAFSFNQLNVCLVKHVSCVEKEFRNRVMENKRNVSPGQGPLKRMSGCSCR
jgi:hypothetical protein